MRENVTAHPPHSGSLQRNPKGQGQPPNRNRSEKETPKPIGTPSLRSEDEQALPRPSFHLLAIPSYFFQCPQQQQRR